VVEPALREPGHLACSVDQRGKRAQPRAIASTCKTTRGPFVDERDAFQGTSESGVGVGCANDVFSFASYDSRLQEE
jgi:hypothetical protein